MTTTYGRGRAISVDLLYSVDDLLETAMPKVIQKPQPKPVQPPRSGYYWVLELGKLVKVPRNW